MSKILKFHAPWCGPCKLLNPTIKKVCETLEVPLTSIDVDQDKTLIMRYNIRSVPTLVMLNDDETVAATRHGNGSEKELTEWINDNLTS